MSTHIIFLRGNAPAAFSQFILIALIRATYLYNRRTPVIEKFKVYAKMTLYNYILRKEVIPYGNFL